MAGVQILPKVGEADRREWKIVGAVTDNDIGKPVKLSAGDGQVTLCSTTDTIYGFIDTVEQGTDGGLVVVTLAESGTVRVTSGAAIALGAVVHAGVNTEAGTAVASYGIVLTHVAAAGEKNWRALTAASGAGEDIIVKLD